MHVRARTQYDSQSNRLRAYELVVCILLIEQYEFVVQYYAYYYQLEQQQQYYYQSSQQQQHATSSSTKVVECAQLSCIIYYESRIIYIMHRVCILQYYSRVLLILQLVLLVICILITSQSTVVAIYIYIYYNAQSIQARIVHACCSYRLTAFRFQRLSCRFKLYHWCICAYHERRQGIEFVGLL